jgi:UDPglucose 6-dehydrogenase
MDIPGPDGKVGFGGHCFPKDTMALLSYSENIAEFMSVLEEVIDVNNKIRNPWEELKYW